jgi:hypothetical protein
VDFFLTNVKFHHCYDGWWTEVVAAVDDGDSGQRSMAADACFQWQGDDSSVLGSSNS